MSAAISPVCGRAYTMLSILTASTGPSDDTGSPVNGDSSWVGDGGGVGVADAVGLGLGVGAACCPPVRATAVAATAPVTTTADAPTRILVLTCHIVVCRRYGVRLASIWSKSPNPLFVPPPPDHCHMSA